MSVGLQCIVCKRFRGIGTCEAYPDGIPGPILMGDHDHTEPFPGDNSIQFEAIDDAERE